MPIDPKWIDAAADAVLAMERAYGDCADIVGSYEGDDAGHVEIQWPGSGSDDGYMRISCPVGQEAEHAAVLDAEVRERRHPGVMRRCGTCASAKTVYPQGPRGPMGESRGVCQRPGGPDHVVPDGPPWDCRWWKER